MYKVYCLAGIIKNWFRGEELVGINSIAFPPLNDVDPHDLSEVTLIQASRASTRWQNKAVARTVCQCYGACQTRRCPCKGAKLSCCTKCHPKGTQCKNVESWLWKYASVCDGCGSVPVIVEVCQWMWKYACLWWLWKYVVMRWDCLLFVYWFKVHLLYADTFSFINKESVILLIRCVYTQNACCFISEWLL